MQYHTWHAKKGMLLILVCYELNLTSIPRHTWRIDSNATIHISVSKQGCLSCRRPCDGERYIYVTMANQLKLRLEGLLGYY